MEKKISFLIPHGKILSLKNSRTVTKLRIWGKLRWFLMISSKITRNFPTIIIELVGTRKQGPWKNGLRKNGPLEKWSLGKRFLKKKSPERRSLEKWSPETCPQKIVLRQNNARKFEWLLFLLIDSTTHTKRCLKFTSRSYMHQTVEH